MRTAFLFEIGEPMAILVQGLAAMGLLEKVGAAMQSLMSDRHTAVRKAVIKAVSAWLCNLT